MEAARLLLPTYPILSKIVGGCTITLFVWEHFGRQKKWTIRPSIGLKKFSQKSLDFFSKAGNKFAVVSSFLAYLKLGEIIITMKDLVGPLIRIICSPLSTIYGFCQYANKHGDKSWIVYLGGVLILTLLITASVNISNNFCS